MKKAYFSISATVSMYVQIKRLQFECHCEHIHKLICWALLKCPPMIGCDSWANGYLFVSGEYAAAHYIWDRTYVYVRVYTIKNQSDLFFQHRVLQFSVISNDTLLGIEAACRAAFNCCALLSSYIRYHTTIIQKTTTWCGWTLKHLLSTLQYNIYIFGPVHKQPTDMHSMCCCVILSHVHVFVFFML